MPSKTRPPVFRPLGSLVVSETGPQYVRLESARVAVELRVLADDLFRIRIAPTKKLHNRHSYAVASTSWPPIAARIHASRREVGVETARGKLLLRLADGFWQLLDHSGKAAFSGLPKKTGFSGEQSRVTLALPEGECLFGLGETTGPFNKRGLDRILWNIDVLGHAPAIHPGLKSLYLSIPFAISLRRGRAAGLFWDNPGRQSWNLGEAQPDEWQMQAQTGEIDLYLFLGPGISNVVSRFTELTGRMPLPALWALGYHQCRYSYESQKRVEEIARTFRRKQIPCDAIYLDIHHMNGYRVFTFGKTFPRPAQLLSKLAKEGFKVVAIVDPGVKDDPRFPVLKRGKSQAAFVKAADGKLDYIGKVWPGSARFPDFLNARARSWWGGEQARFQKIGIAGFWNDMNEPANFAMPTKTLPEDCVHDCDGSPVTHREIHNAYGMEMASACQEGALTHDPDRRPFVISRAGYAGVQRHALVWTGDNSSVWEHLRDSIQMLLNLGLSGVPFCGADVGGFLGNATGELLVRWTQLAAFTPFFRNHSNIGTRDQEPWAFGPRVEAICKRFIELRYQLLPYLYGLFVEAHRTGAPIMRPLLWHYQDDPGAVASDDQFLLGENLLIAPILRPGETARSVYLPRGAWFDFWSGQRHAGQQHILARAELSSIPVYARAGAIIPMTTAQQYTGQRAWSIVHLHIWAGERGELRWYEDDGSSMACARGQTHEREIEFLQKGRSYSLQFAPAQGDFQSQVKLWRVIVHGTGNRFSVLVDGQPIKARFDGKSRRFSFQFPNSPSLIEIQMHYRRS